MNLPIIDSMLRGDLRRQVLSTLKSEKEISLLWKELAQSGICRTSSLMDIELNIIAAVETSGLVKVTPYYKADRELRQGAEQAHSNGMYLIEEYTPISEFVVLDGLFGIPSESTPTDRFLHLLTNAECIRTLVCLQKQAISYHDDAVMRTDIKKLFQKILAFCKDTDDQFIRETLTQLYFEIYHTFKPVLENGASQAYETDFKNFIFEWYGAFPVDEVVRRYEEKVIGSVRQVKTSSNITLGADLESVSPAVQHKAKDKFDKFLDEANNFTFSQMPKVLELGTEIKTRQLVECLLEEKESAADTFGHAAAMLEFLGFYKWIAEQHISGYKKTQFDSWCSKVIMNKEAGTAYRHYRLSVDVSPEDNQNASYKYLGWKYKDTVASEYNKILNS